MVIHTAVIEKFAENKDKSGWTYVVVPAEVAQKIKPNTRKEYKVKGLIDEVAIDRVSLMPMGGGDYLIPLNAKLRKEIQKPVGEKVILQLEEDTSAFVFNADFIECLRDEPVALEFFNSLSGSHQRYFSTWIDSAKTIETKARRIAQAVDGLAKKWDYGQMIRANKKQ